MKQGLSSILLAIAMFISTAPITVNADIDVSNSSSLQPVVFLPLVSNLTQAANGIQMHALADDESWEEQLRGILINEGKTPEVINQIIAEGKSLQMVNASSVEKKNVDNGVDEIQAAINLGCDIGQGATVNGFTRRGTFAMSFASSSGQKYGEGSGYCDASMCYMSDWHIPVAGVTMAVHATVPIRDGTWAWYAYKNCVW